MNGKSGEKKLGRNPFDHKRPSRAKRHEPAPAPEANVIPQEPAILNLSEPRGPESREDRSSGTLYPANPAWFFVDLWAGAIMEPYFFWAKSVDIIKRTML